MQSNSVALLYVLVRQNKVKIPNTNVHELVNAVVPLEIVIMNVFCCPSSSHSLHHSYITHTAGRPSWENEQLNMCFLKFVCVLQSGFLLARLVKHTTENFASEEDAEEVEAFFRDHLSPGTERTVQQSCESIRLNAAWLRRDRETTREYLISGK
jgi:hypothetical protein